MSIAATDPRTVGSRSGCVHLWSRTLIPTAKQPPADAESPSHKLLARGGFIRRVAAGVYDYLPLGYRVLRKISEIVREEMEAAGASELLLPALCPTELLKETGRADAYGDLLFRFDDRHGRDSYLGPTHEEVITELMRAAVSSYKSLPLNLFQIQSKYRDEFRPRAGLLRCREFLMKDAYSFHIAADGPGGLDETYQKMYDAYVRIFRRCGLDFSVVEAESGPIGGSASHEFMVNCETGEDTILVCPETGYAANVEKCETGERPWSFEGEPTGDAEDVHTPDCPGIEDVCKLLKVKPRHMLKSVVFKVQSSAEDLAKYGEEWVVAVVRGDHEVNEGKVRDAAECPVELADPEEARAMGFAIGFVSPRAAIRSDPAEQKRVLLLIDADAARGVDADSGKPMFWVTGADRADHHTKHFNWARDLGVDPAAAAANEHFLEVADIRNAVAGDPSPRAPAAALEARRGIEVGHIFKLGDKYSRAMGFEILDEQQRRTPVIMGCYGIGVSRTVAACVEMSHDDNGVVWPAPVAPYHALVIPMKTEPGSRERTAADHAARRLAERGFEVLVDDRDERAGVKFKDADLIGVPLRIVLGEKALDQNSAEAKHRRHDGKAPLVPLDDLERWAEETINA
mgnify:CR=1 FL=1